MTNVLASEARSFTQTIGAQDATTTRELAASLTQPAGSLIDDPRWLARARQAWPDLPPRLVRELREFRRDSGAFGVKVICGLPVGEAALPPTPNRRGSVQREATMAAAVLATIASGLGDPAAYRLEKAGAIVQDVVPVPGFEQDQSNAGSTPLGFHTENAFHPQRPDFVMLLCLRSDHEKVAEIRTGCIRQVLSLLSGKSRDELFKPSFITSPPPSFGLRENASEAHAILTGARDDPDMRIDVEATKPIDADAEAAMSDLGKLLAANSQALIPEPGDLVIIDNRVTVHGRSCFIPRYDGSDRWLQRTFVLTDLRRSREFRGGDGHVLG